MKVDRLPEPRRFRVGRDRSIELAHCANIELAPDEQVTFVTPSGTEFDVVRKDWGYYGTPSLNARLPEHGLRPALVRGKGLGRWYLLLVEPSRRADFEKYVEMDQLEVVCWLDEAETADRLQGAFDKPSR